MKKVIHIALFFCLASCSGVNIKTISTSGFKKDYYNSALVIILKDDQAKNFQLKTLLSGNIFKKPGYVIKPLAYSEEGYTVEKKNTNGNSSINTSYYATYQDIKDIPAREIYFHGLSKTGKFKPIIEKNNLTSLFHIHVKKRHHVKIVRRLDNEKEVEIKEGPGFYDPDERYSVGHLLEKSLFGDEIIVNNFIEVDCNLFDIHSKKITWQLFVKNIPVEYHNEEQQERVYKMIVDILLKRIKEEKVFILD